MAVVRMPITLLPHPSSVMPKQPGSSSVSILSRVLRGQVGTGWGVCGGGRGWGARLSGLGASGFGLGARAAATAACRACARCCLVWWAGSACKGTARRPFVHASCRPRPGWRSSLPAGRATRRAQQCTLSGTGPASPHSWCFSVPSLAMVPPQRVKCTPLYMGRGMMRGAEGVEWQTGLAHIWLAGACSSRSDAPPKGQLTNLPSCNQAPPSHTP